MAAYAYEAFFDRSIQYYAAGRFAGNLLHHAVEMCLKGALSKKGTSLVDLRKLGHKLSKIWNEFKLQANDPTLGRFDTVVATLNRFEDLRYPDAVLKKGMLSGFELKKAHTAKVTGLAARVPRYTLCLEAIDELVGAVFKIASIDPKFFTCGSRVEKKRYLGEENVWPVV